MFLINPNLVMLSSIFQLTEKLSQCEQELDQVLISKEETEVELEASVTARGAGNQAKFLLCVI